MIFENNLESDLFIPIFRNNPNTGGGVGPNKMIHSLSEREDWDTMKLDHPEYGFNQPWGPGIMYEMALPLALYLGCKKIVTIGWDIGDLSSFENGTEDDTQRVFKNTFMVTNTKRCVCKNIYGAKRNKISSKSNKRYLLLVKRTRCRMGNGFRYQS